MVEAKSVLAVLVIALFLYWHFDMNLLPHLLPREYCPDGTVPSPDNPKLCIEDTGQPTYYPVMKEGVFMLLVFISLTYIFTRKK